MRKDYAASLARCRMARDTEGGRAFLALLHAAADLSREELVTAPEERVARLQGAVLRLRELARAVEQEPAQSNGEDGAYA